MSAIERLCDVAGCPKAEDHFPLVQLILPIEMGLAVALMQAIEDGLQQQGLRGVMVDLPGHGNGRLYAATRPAGGGSS